jgi:hypothetical protein
LINTAQREAFREKTPQPWRIRIGISALAGVGTNQTDAPVNQVETQKTKSSKPMQPVPSVTHSTTVLAAFGLLSALLLVSHTAHAQDDANFAAPTVFQAAGPTAASIQSTVDEFRAALGKSNNGNNPGPLLSGRREINWDGGNPAIVVTTPPVTPFNVFLNTRGAQFTTPGGVVGGGLSQATPGGLAVLFANPTYAKIFKTFSASRLFTPVGSNITDGSFFIPGSNGGTKATVTGFGAVFTDVDQPDGGPGSGSSHTEIEYFDRAGKKIFSSSIPPSPGEGNLSFFGIVFADPRIASVRIRTDDAPGRFDDRRHDIVMMDDFIYGEPQFIQDGGVVRPLDNKP